MKRKIYLLMLYMISLTALIFHAPGFAEQLLTADVAKLDEKEALQLAVDAYIFGYPLITMDVTSRIMTNIPVPDDICGAPMGEFVNTRQYSNAASKRMNSPNADTLYTGAWIDLAKEPYLIHIPEADKRYAMVEMLSGWGEVFANLGSRSGYLDVRNAVIVGPRWKGTLPKGLVVIQSPTNLVWVIGRLYCAGTQEDYDTVHAPVNTSCLGQ